MSDRFYAGIDIGGTKTTTILARADGRFYARDQFPTTTGLDNWQSTLERARSCIEQYTRQKEIAAIGISCGGPLDSKQGLILSPPNLPGWDQVPLSAFFKEAFHLPVFLENDANAGALAEWQFGAGKGSRNLIFLTFGTGLGAGLILDGRLYAGTNDLSGEAGHIRLAEEGPVGYHKRGSFEGFCSGTGLAQLMAFELLCLGEEIGPSEMLKKYKPPGEVTGKDVVEWALADDPLALKVIAKSGDFLGRGLAILVDILNPEIIIIGGMGVRLGDLLLEPARSVISKEALPAAATVCRVVPAALGERIGDYAALCVALGGQSG
ncbi:MAG: ROK family protein [Candidatus Neomarinimicrobiota bacterium]